jgi:hypothetical protein
MAYFQLQHADKITTGLDCFPGLSLFMHTECIPVANEDATR